MSKNNFKEIISKIKSGGIKQRSRWFFALKTAGRALLVLVIGLTVVYFISWIFFSLNQTGARFLPGFGWRGWQAFLGIFPWATAGLIFVLFVVIEAFLRKSGAVYKRPIIYSFGILIIACTLVGVTVNNATPFHRNFGSSVREAGIPVFHRMYEVNERGPSLIGKIIEISEEYLKILNPMNEEVMVDISKTRMPMEYELREGDLIVIGGIWKDGEIKSFGIKPVSPDFPMMPPPIRMMHR